MADLVIQGGDVVTPDGIRCADVRMANGLIEAVAPGLAGRDDEVVDARGLWVLPGLIDCHTHFGLENNMMRTLDDYAAGSAAAAAGGVTTYINFVPQAREENLVAALEREMPQAVGHSLVDFAFHLSFGTPGPSWQQELSELAGLGVTSVKVYTTYRDTSYYTTDWNWYQLLEAAGKEGVLVQVHAENDAIIAGSSRLLAAAGQTSLPFHGRSRPEAAEIEAVARGLGLALSTGAPIYFVHLSSPRSVALVRQFREQGVTALAEVCPHHLCFDDRLYQSPQVDRYIMTPPLRPATSVAGLREQVVAGQIDAIGSDHCGYALAQRGAGRTFAATSPGIPGVETLWPVLYTQFVASGLMDVVSVSNLVSRAPAEWFGLGGKKGVIAVGADADLLLYDPKGRAPLNEADLHGRAGYSPWHGHEIQGRVVRTISRGKTVYRNGEVCGSPQHGRYVPCRRFGSRGG